MKIAHTITLLLLFSAILFPAHAQDTTDNWTITQQCLEAQTPPDDWAFDGTIIAAGWAGIHGINAAWETPRILAFRDQWIEEGGSGTLSPDGRWYVVPQVRLTPVQGDRLRANAHVQQLMVYELIEGGSILRIEWEDAYEVEFGGGINRFYSFRSPVWFDNDTFIYQRGDAFYRVQLPDLEIEEWSEAADWQDSISPVWQFVAYPSPDWSRIVTATGLFSTATNGYLANGYDPDADWAAGAVAWHPDSSEFVFSGASATQLYDADGTVLDTISAVSETSAHNPTSVRVNAYAPDGSRFWLIVRAEGDSQHLAIANRAARTIVDTCVAISDTTSVQFSPDGRYLAFATERELGQLHIIDVENWQLYDTGLFHRGVLIGWRADSD